ncbi:MAG: hypothetical protein ACKVOR_07255 [Flavobacteriales bacterium]
MSREKKVDSLLSAVCKSHRQGGFHRVLILVLLFIVALFVVPASAQIIDNRLGNAFKEEMFFNQQFLWTNKVKSMTGTTSIKRPNRPIDQRPDLLVYHFNEVGLLNQLDKVSSVLTIMDSLTIEYQRSQTGEVETKTENGTRGYFTTQFNYDKDGHLTRLDFAKAENISQDKNKLEPGRVININSETFAWTEIGPGVWKRANYNNYGLHYSNLTITRNEAGYLVSEVEELMMSGRTTTRTYTYDEHGWISNIETTDNQTANKKTEVFTYDKLGNLTKVEYKDKDVLVREVEILYTATMLVEAFLDHDIQSHDIVITKFQYEFYE